MPIGDAATVEPKGLLALAVLRLITSTNLNPRVREPARDECVRVRKRSMRRDAGQIPGRACARFLSSTEFSTVHAMSWTDGFAEEIVRPRRYLNWNIFLAGPGQWVRSPSAERRSQMSPLRMRMIEDMKLAGLSPGTQATYIDAVRKLAAHYRRSPDQLSEEEVRAYILNLREGGAARGTFKANYYGIQYLYRYTVNRDWALFTKKTFVCRNRSGYPTHSPTPRFAGCLAA